MKTAVIIGVGPVEGLGAQLCIRFAELGMHVLVAGRTAEKLAMVVSVIEQGGGTATAVQTDARNEEQVKALFDQAGDQLEAAIFNVGNNTPGRLLEMEASYFENSWRTCCFAGFLFGREAGRRFIQQDNSSANPTLLFTGASASLRGRANFGAFNASKGALRNLAQALAKEYAENDIHVSHVIVDGPISGEKIKTLLPEYAEKLGEQGMISLRGIVDAYEFLYRQNPTAWSFELDLRTSKESW
ncbi:MAG: SDR family NAD(P)-dependent oxidoreductase [Pseudomonadales bacterium]